MEGFIGCVPYQVQNEPDDLVLGEYRSASFRV